MDYVGLQAKSHNPYLYCNQMLQWTMVNGLTLTKLVLLCTA